MILAVWYKQELLLFFKITTVNICSFIDGVTFEIAPKVHYILNAT